MCLLRFKIILLILIAIPTDAIYSRCCSCCSCCRNNSELGNSKSKLYSNPGSKSKPLIPVINPHNPVIKSLPKNIPLNSDEANVETLLQVQNECSKLNQKLLKAIQRCFVKKVLKTKYDDLIQNNKNNLQNLSNILGELRNITRDLPINESGSKVFIDYDELRKDICSENYLRAIYTLTLMINSSFLDKCDKGFKFKRKKETLGNKLIKKQLFSDLTSALLYCFIDLGFKNSIHGLIQHLDRYSYMYNCFILKFSDKILNKYVIEDYTLIGNAQSFINGFDYFTVQKVDSIKFENECGIVFSDAGLTLKERLPNDKLIADVTIGDLRAINIQISNYE